MSHITVYPEDEKSFCNVTTWQGKNTMSGKWIILTVKVTFESGGTCVPIQDEPIIQANHTVRRTRCCPLENGPQQTHYTP